ncbi:MAG TPA: IPT/TIG domain-containing protein [Solirubrobacterales bacterium]
MRKVLLSVIACLAILIPAVGTSQAAVVTVGSPLTQPFAPTAAARSGTVINAALPGGGLVASPVSGVVIRWRVGGAEGGPMRVRVLRPTAGGAYTGAGTGPDTVVPPGSPATLTFPVSLPIQAGDVIGVDLPEDTKIGTFAPSSASFGAWEGFVPDGSTLAPEEVKPGREIGFNADVLPPPTATAVKPASGSFKGGGKLTIEGTNLIEVSAVGFGGIPATSIASSSESTLTVVAPKAPKPGRVGVTVRTPAGTATVPTLYAYKACKVPALRGKTLAKAKKKLKKAGCKVGKVKRLPGGTGKVTAQKPKPGKLKAPGAKVKVTVG